MHHQGKYIAVQRFKQGYKQWQFARLVGLSPQRMSVIEQTAELEEPTLQKIATALKVPVQEIEEGGGHRRLSLKKSQQRNAKRLEKQKYFL